MVGGVVEGVGGVAAGMVMGGIPCIHAYIPGIIYIKSA